MSIELPVATKHRRDMTEQMLKTSNPNKQTDNKQTKLVVITGPRQANLVLIAYASNESRGTFRQKARSLAPLNGWACAVEICHDGMLEDTNSLDGAQLLMTKKTPNIQ